MGWIYSGIHETDKERKYNDFQLLKKIMHNVAPFKMAFIFVIIMVIFSTILSLISPLVVSVVLEQIRTGTLDFEIMLVFSGIYIFMYLLQYASYFGNNYAMAKLIPDFMVNLRTDIFGSFQTQDLKFFDKRRSGRLTARVGGDAAESANIVMLMATFGGNILLIFTTFVILFYISVQLALLVLVVVPFIIIATMSFRRLARRASSEYRKSVASVNAAISESVEGISIAKSFGRERETVSKFTEINTENVKTGFKQNVIMGSIFPTLDILSVIGLFLIIQFGGNWALADQFNLNETALYIFILYFNRFFFPLMQMSTFYSQLQAGFAAYERIVDVTEAEPEVYDMRDGVVIDNFRGDIKFIETDFGYEKDEFILKKFNLHIKPGEKIAIVGHTGAGKTTITNIIARFYEYQGGSVLIDNQEIRSLNLKEYRKNLGIVQQDPFLFSGTVRENIVYGHKDATEEELSNAISAVKAEEFLRYLPNGLDTEVGERGSRLSTGQRQLVCFARALLTDPKIIILDEATSAVDAYTEAAIEEALATLFANRTSIVIAHRLSTVVNADRIIVLKGGKIIEEGSHEDLIALNGQYQELYQTYFEHQALAIQ